MRRYSVRAYRVKLSRRTVGKREKLINYSVLDAFSNVLLSLSLSKRISEYDVRTNNFVSIKNVTFGEEYLIRAIDLIDLNEEGSNVIERVER